MMSLLQEWMACLPDPHRRRSYQEWISSGLDHGLCDFPSQRDRAYRCKPGQLLQSGQLGPERVAFGDGRENLFCMTLYAIKSAVDKDLCHGFLEPGFLIYRLFHRLHRPQETALHRENFNHHIADQPED